MNNKTITVLAVDDPAVRGYQALNIISDYEKKTGQAVDFEVVSWEKYGEMYNEILLGKKTYDIFMVAGHLWLPELLAKELVVPLLVPKEELLEKILDEITVENKQYLSPSFCDGHLFVYRKKYFEEHGLSLPKKHVTVTEISEWAQSLALLINKPPIAMKSTPSELFLDILPYLRTIGGEPISEEGEPINDFTQLDKGIALYKKMLELAGPLQSSLGNEEVKNSIQQDEVVMAITWNGQMGDIYTEKCLRKEELSFSTIANSWNVTWSFAIHSASTQKEKAQDFLNFLLSREIADLIGNFSGSPVLKPVSETQISLYPWYLEHYQLVSRIAQQLPKSTKLGKSMDLITKYVIDKLKERV